MENRPDNKIINPRVVRRPRCRRRTLSISRRSLINWQLADIRPNYTRMKMKMEMRDLTSIYASLKCERNQYT
jgi:hypothetical protein